MRKPRVGDTVKITGTINIGRIVEIVERTVPGAPAFKVAIIASGNTLVYRKLAGLVFAL